LAQLDKFPAELKKRPYNGPQSLLAILSIKYYLAGAFAPEQSSVERVLVV
jgi:hypothetical protein